MATAPSPYDVLDQVRLATPKDPVGLPLSLPAGVTASEARKTVAREALRWTYVLRSRRRWVGDSRARERYEEEARTALRAIGIGEAELGQLGEAERIVVRVPYPFEEMHWEARIFPWEYLLAAATRDSRVKRADGGRPRPLTVMRELQRQPQVTAVRAAAPTGNDLRVLFVECLPSVLREAWSLDSERKRLHDALPGATWHLLSYPTMEELRSAVATFKPHLLHFAGLDSHQGLRELRLQVGTHARVDLGPHVSATSNPPPASDGDDAAQTPYPLVDDVIADRSLMVDGVLLRGDTGLPRLVRAFDLARQLLASGHQAYLASFNLWNTAARVAPLVVAEGAALAAIGFQDAFDDALAEFVHATVYGQLVATGWNLPLAFESTWRVVRDLPESVDATGITLWAGAPLLAAARAAPAVGPAAIAGPAAPATVRCDIKPLSELNYAVLHNAQPLFEKFVLECDQPGDAVRVDVDVAVHMGSETARYKRQVVMKHRREALTHEIHVPLTADVARTVREAISSSLSVLVSQGERVLYCDTHRLRLLPVDQWRDNRRDGRWLPSFVQPRDPAITSALAMAQRYNRVLRDDPSAGFEGYQLADPADEDSLRGVDRQVEAIWATLLHDWRLGYINPPPTYSGTLDSQRLRMPSTVLQHRAGTCIDLALLFAACLELIDVYPVVFLLDGHALPGWWRHPSFRDEYFEMPGDNFNEIVPASSSENTVANAQVVAWHTGKASWPEVRRWIRERKLVPIETVRLTEHCGFVEAIEAGVSALAERRDFDSMLDIVTARTEQVTPLPLLKEPA
jgi:hypothetical protein